MSCAEAAEEGPNDSDTDPFYKAGAALCAAGGEVVCPHSPVMGCEPGVPLGAVQPSDRYRHGSGHRLPAGPSPASKLSSETDATLSNEDQSPGAHGVTAGAVRPEIYSVKLLRAHQPAGQNCRAKAATLAATLGRRDHVLGFVEDLLWVGGGMRVDASGLLAPDPTLSAEEGRSQIGSPV
ncbi:hypothetical protein P4O66_002434 [Electrophorus voltai]|uniref:Uncharacterized protein n=1 Tax=Electrophorus voltai TaxID=2609070 RepID=A0AAD9DR27_9TELE|nr:hypothetical protein P4O66_002434 [Electrophorus voltai]